MWEEILKILGLGGSSATPSAIGTTGVPATGIEQQSVAIPVGQGSAAPPGATSGLSTDISQPLAGMGPLLKDFGNSKGMATTPTAAPPTTGKIVPPLPPLKLPEYTAGGSLQGLLQAIEQRRARLAALGTGMSMGGLGG